MQFRQVLHPNLLAFVRMFLIYWLVNHARASATPRSRSHFWGGLGLPSVLDRTIRPANVVLLADQDHLAIAEFEEQQSCYRALSNSSSTSGSLVCCSLHRNPPSN